MEGYCAPELLRQRARYSEKVDIWALGCVAHEIVARRLAFQTDWEIYNYTQKREITIVPPHCSSEGPAGLTFRRIICDMLQVESTERPSAKSLHQKFSSMLQGILGPRETLGSLRLPPAIENRVSLDANWQTGISSISFDLTTIKSN
jgi:serine/threonine protein kinase